MHGSDAPHWRGLSSCLAGGGGVATCHSTELHDSDRWLAQRVPLQSGHLLAWMPQEAATCHCDGMPRPVVASTLSSTSTLLPAAALCNQATQKHICLPG